MIERDHPFFGLSELFNIEGANFTFSKYKYVADSLFDEREIIKVNSEQISETWICSQIESLIENQELALHSLVNIRGRNFHIPMIDFSLDQEFSMDVYDRIARYIPKKVLSEISFYSSGRSYHAYSLNLLGPKEWLEFMGRLLLINPPHSSSIIDSRWIGHRLIGGFSSLRWSNNTNQYLAMPRKIKFP